MERHSIIRVAFFVVFIEFIGVILVNKIIKVSGARCIMCLPPQVKFLSITTYPPYTLPPPLTAQPLPELLSACSFIHESTTILLVC